MDPKPTVGISGYNTFGGNPIWFSDVKGDTTGGVDQRSADRLYDAAQFTFSDDKFKDVRKLIKLNGGYYLGMYRQTSFRPIEEKDFANAIKDLSPDDQALAFAYYSAINSKELHTVELIKLKESYSKKAEERMTGPGNGALVEYFKSFSHNIGTPYDIEKSDYDPKNVTGSYSIIVINSETTVNYQTSSITGSAMKIKPSIAELVFHEIVGHGLGRLFSASNDMYAIQANNLYLRAGPEAGDKRWRNGSDHDGISKPIPYIQANTVPDYIKAGLFQLKLNQALSGNSF